MNRTNKPRKKPHPRHPALRRKTTARGLDLFGETIKTPFPVYIPPQETQPAKLPYWRYVE